MLSLIPFCCSRCQCLALAAGIAIIVGAGSVEAQSVFSMHMPTQAPTMSLAAAGQAPVSNSLPAPMLIPSPLYGGQPGMPTLTIAQTDASAVEQEPEELGEPQVRRVNKQLQYRNEQQPTFGQDSRQQDNQNGGQGYGGSSQSNQGNGNRPTGTQSQLLDFNGQFNPWIPYGPQTQRGRMAELPIPPQFLNCRCKGATPGAPCRVYRYFEKPTDVDEKCLVCVKEPYLDCQPVEEKTEAVVYKCFETSEPFTDEGCEAGKWYKSSGSKQIRQLYPCNVAVVLRYKKPIVRYRDVWYYIDCRDQPSYGGQGQGLNY